jgi:hypothetical protein
MVDYTEGYRVETGIDRPPIRGGNAIPKAAARAATAIAEEYEFYCVFPEKDCPNKGLDDICTRGDCPEGFGEKRKRK